MSFQAEVGAWFAAYLIARMPVGGRFGIDTSAIPVALRLETGDGLDDIEVSLSNGGTIHVQCKTSANMSTAADTPLAKTIGQLAAWVGAASASGHTPDPARSAGVLAVRADAPRSLDALDHGCRALDHGGTWQQTLASRSNVERDALQIFETPARAAWGAAAGSAPADVDVVTMARLFRICRFSMTEGDSDWREAARLLGGRVFGDEAAGETPLRDLKGVLRSLISAGAAADREGLLQALRRLGHRDVGTPGFEPEVARLRAWTTTELARLAKHGRLPIGAGIRLPRDCDGPLVDAISLGSLLVVGEPGAGKTGALVHAAETIVAHGGTVVFLSVDQFPGVAVNADLMSELGLGHPVVDSLAAMPGAGPKVLFVDALDAARGGPSEVVFASLIESVQSRLTGWTVVASIRTFDLKNGKRFREAFKGTPPKSEHAEGTLPTVSHFVIRLLSDPELTGVGAASADLSTLLSSAPTALRNLLKNVFNLSLAAQLLSDGTSASAFGSIATQSGLIDVYEDTRLNSTALQLAAARTASTMVSRRRLVVRKTLVDHASLDAAIQTGVLVESGDLVQFAHHVLFDHVAGRFMLEWDDSGALIRQLEAETSTALMLAPALRFAVERVWRTDGEGRPATWQLLSTLFATEQVDPVLGHVVLRVAAENVEREEDLRGLTGLVRALPTDPALHRQLGLLSQYVGMEMAASTPPSVRAVAWSRLAEVLLTTGQRELLFPALGLVRALFERGDLKDIALLSAFGGAARALLEDVWAMTPSVLGLSVLPIRAVARSFASDPVASRALLARILQEPRFSLHADQEAPWVAEHIGVVAQADPEFAIEIYRVIYGQDITDTATTSLGGQPSRILPLSSNRRQDYEHGRWRLSTALPQLLAMSAETGTRAVIETLIGKATSQDYAANHAPRQLRIGNLQVELRRSKVEISSWREDNTQHDDNPLKHYTQFLRTCSVEAFQACVEAASRGPTTEAIWIRIFGVAGDRVAEVADLLWPLLDCPAFLDTRKTAADTARFAAKAWPTRSPAERVAFERMILDESHLEDAAHRERWRYTLAQFLAKVQEDALELEGTRNLRRAFAAEDLLDERPREGMTADFQIGDIDVVRRHMRRDGVDLDSEANRDIYDASNALFALVSQTPGDAPRAALAALWPSSMALVQMLDANPLLHPQLDRAAWGHVSNAVERIATSDIYDPEQDGLPSLDDLLSLVARLSISPYPSQPVDRDSGSLHWGNLDVRVYAASVLVHLVHRFSDERPGILDQLEAFLADPAPAVRLQVAQNLQVISVADTERMWRLGERIAATETNLEVIAAYLNRSLKRFGESDPDRCEVLLAIVKGRIEHEWGDEEVKLSHLRDVLGGWASELYVEDGRARAGEWLEEWSGDLVLYQPLLTFFVSTLRGHLFARYQQDVSDKQRAVTDRAQQSVAQILDRACAAAAEDHATFTSDADSSVKEAVLPRYKAASMVINHAMSQFYFGSGAYQGVEGQERTPIGLLDTDAKARFLQDYAQILGYFANSTEPSTLHHLIELYEFLIPGDPVGVFEAVHQILHGAGRNSGYHFENLGSTAVVRLVKRYIADHRSIFDEESRRGRLVAVLRLFSEVGWPEALRLLYDLPELLR